MKRTRSRFVRAGLPRSRSHASVARIASALVASVLSFVAAVAMGDVPVADAHERQVWLPPVGDIIEVPLIAVRRDEIVIDGIPSGRTDEATTGRVVLLEGVRERLLAFRDREAMFHAHGPRATGVVIQCEPDVPASAVKSVIETAVAAGYPQHGSCADSLLA